MNQEEKNKIISGGVTAVVLGLILVICLAFGYDPPDPPIPEEGVEVNLGNSDNGFGNNPMPAASEASSAPRPVSATEQVSTQKTESTTPMPSSEKPSTAKTDNTTPTTTKPEPPKEPEINKNALFNGSRSSNKNKNGGSEGKTYGSGNQGKEGGDPNSNRYDGTPGKGGAGFSLAGRSARALPSPNTNTNKEGKVVVKIWVDQYGKVQKAVPGADGTTVTDKALWTAARNAALETGFNMSSSAPALQEGTITYIFNLK